MALWRTLLAQLRTIRSRRRPSKTLHPGTYLPKRFPFIWLCLLLAIGNIGYCQENLEISFDAVSAVNFAKLAQDNLFSLSTASVEYTAYPFILRTSRPDNHTSNIIAKVTSGWTDSTGIALPSASLDWAAATWVWEGREEYGPAPGLQFSARIPLLAAPGRYTATVQVSLLDNGKSIDSFPLTLTLVVPRWAACRAWPQVLKAYQKSLGEPGQEILESEHLRFIIAANTDWALWIHSPWLSAPELAAEGSNTISSRSGYLINTYRLRKKREAGQDPVPAETTLQLLLKY